MACTMRGIKFNVGALSMLEWKDFYLGNKKDPYLPHQILELHSAEGCLEISLRET